MLVIMNILGAFEGASSSLVGGDSMISFAIFRAYHNTHSHSLASASWCSTHGESQNAVVLSPPQHAPEVCLYVCTRMYIYMRTRDSEAGGTHIHTRAHTHTHTPQRERRGAKHYRSVLCRYMYIYICAFTYIYKTTGGHLVLGLASGLEAFSREPPCDGFGALAVRQTPETRGTAWEFLSYYPILPSRYLRDPFTISHTNDIYIYICIYIYMVVMSVPSTAHRSPGPRTTRRPLCTDNLFLAISS